MDAVNQANLVYIDADGKYGDVARMVSLMQKLSDADRELLLDFGERMYMLGRYIASTMTAEIALGKEDFMDWCAEYSRRMK